MFGSLKISSGGGLPLQVRHAVLPHLQDLQHPEHPGRVPRGVRVQCRTQTLRTGGRHHKQEQQDRDGQAPDNLPQGKRQGPRQLALTRPEGQNIQQSYYV